MWAVGTVRGGAATASPSADGQGTLVGMELAQMPGVLCLSPTPCAHLLPAATMGAGGSKPEDIAKLAQDDGGYKPPLGPPNPVSCC